MKGWPGMYDLEWVQIINIDWKRNMISGTNEYSKSTSGEGLDRLPNPGWDGNYSLYASNGCFFTYGCASDSPGEVLTDDIAYDWRQDDFEVYLMFTPSGGKQVPLKLANWNWYGRAKRSNTNSPAIFEGVTPFVNPVATTGVDCFVHPQWQTNILYYETNWQLNPNPFPTP